MRSTTKEQINKQTISAALPLEAACPANRFPVARNAPSHQISTESDNSRLSYRELTILSIHSRMAGCNMSLPWNLAIPKSPRKCQNILISNSSADRHLGLDLTVS